MKRKPVTISLEENKNALEDRMLHACADYLRSIGWKALVIGGISIERRLGALQFNFRLCVRFTGGSVTDEAQNAARARQLVSNNPTGPEKRQQKRKKETP